MNTREPDLIPSPDSLPTEALRQIGSSILSSLGGHAHTGSGSPPEKCLVALLRMALRDTMVEIQDNEHIILPTSPAMEVELDIVIRQPSTGASAVIEIDGWQWHRRTLQEHDAEVRRDRLIRRYYRNVERYAASEVIRDPWGVLLDIMRMIEDGWTAFDLRIPAWLRALASASALPPTTDSNASSNPDVGSSAKPLPMLERLRSVAADLPPVDPTADPAVQALRRDYPRAYVPWTPVEVECLRDAYHTWIDIDDIARALGRTPGAVWCQLRRMGLASG